MKGTERNDGVVVLGPTGKVIAAIPGGTNNSVFRFSPEIPADVYDFQSAQ